MASNPSEGGSVARGRSSSQQRPRVAFLTPLNPQTSGIADYSEDLLPHLAIHCDIDVFSADGLAPATRSIAEGFQVRGYSQFPACLASRRYDQIVVQMGNSRHHVECYDYLLKYGGIAVLHDLNLSGIIGAKTLARGDVIGFFREMLSAEGAATTSRAFLEFLSTRKLPGPHDWWMNRTALKRSTAVVVHNEYAASLVRSIMRQMRLAAPVRIVPQGVPSPPKHWERGASLSRARAGLGISEGAFVVGSFGALDESKRISVALAAFARLLERHPNSIYLLVGRDLGGYREMVQSMGLAGRVRLTGHVSTTDFYEHIAACDCCIGLRYPSHGETSAALLRVMSMGKPAVISNHAQFREYPDQTCIKLDLGQGEDERLCAALYEVATKPAFATAVGEAALHYIERHHSLKQVAAGYNKVVLDTLRARPS